MAEDGRVTIKAILDADGVTRGVKTMKSSLSGIKADGLKGVDSEAKKAASGLEKAGKAAKDASNSLGSIKVAAGLTAATAAAVGFGKQVVEIGSQFSSSMSNVAALSGATADELSSLEALAREMGATTTFSASQAADALGYMALAGWDTTEMSAGLAPVLQLAQAGSMDLAAASDLCTDYLSAFSMGADETQRMVDVLAYAQGNANTTTEGLGMAFKNCAANCNAAGMDVETTTAAISMMANQGLKGSEAGTALTAVMRDMTARMTDGAIAIGDTSVAVMDSEGNYRDFADILGDVEAATDGMGEAERASALQTTFTADSIKGLNLMLNAGSDELTSFRDELYNCDGAAAQMASTMTDNLEGDVAGMNSAFEEFQLKLFDHMEQPMRDLVQFVTNEVIPGLTDFTNGVFDVAGDLAEFAGENSEAIEVLVGAIGGFAVAKTALPHIQNLAAGVKDFGAKAKDASARSEMLRGAAGNLAGALAAVVIADLLQQLLEYKGLLDDAKGATEGMQSAVDSISGAKAAEEISKIGDTAEESSGKAKTSFQEVTDATHKATEDQAKLAEQIKTTFDGINTDASVLKQATATIEELADKENLTAEEQAKLNAAVEAYNEVTGSSISIIDSQNGKLSAATSAILENADAWEANARAQAAQEALTDVYRQQVENAQALDAVNKKLAESDQGWGIWIEDFAVAADQASVEYHDLCNQQNQLMEQSLDLQAAEESLTRQAASSAEAADAYSESQAALTEAQTAVAGSAEETAAAVETEATAISQMAGLSEEAAEELADMADELSEYVNTNMLFGEMLYDSGYSISTFAAALRDAGIDVSTFETAMDELASKTQDAFSTIQQQGTISLDQMIANLQANQDAVANWQSNIETLYQMAAASGVQGAEQMVESLATMGPEYSAQMAEIIAGGQEGFDQLATTWSNGMQVAIDAAVAEYQIGADALLADTDVTLGQLASKMAESGETIGSIATMGSDEFSALADSLGLSVDQMISICQGLNLDISSEITSGFQAATTAAETESEGTVAATESMQERTSAAAETAAQNQAESAQEGASAVNEEYAKTDQAAEAVEETAQRQEQAAEEAAEQQAQSAQQAQTQVTQAYDELKESVTTSTNALHDSVREAMDPLKDELGSLGTEAGSNFATKLSAQSQAADTAANKLKESAQTKLEGLKTPASDAGTSAGKQYSTGLSSQSGAASTAGSSLVSSANTALSNTADAYTYGVHLGGNYASGIASQMSSVATAASSLSQTAKDYIGHTRPKKGPLKCGEEIFGQHLAQNLASGIGCRKSLNAVAKESNNLAQQVVDYLGHSTPKKGVLKGGEWVYGYHAAQNLAKGLSDGSSEVASAASNTASAVDAQFNRMVAAYKSHVDEMRTTSRDLSLVLDPLKAAGNAYEYTALSFADTGVFKSLKAITDAGYKSLDEYKAAAKSLVAEKESIEAEILQQQETTAEKAQKQRDQSWDYWGKAAEAEADAAKKAKSYRDKSWEYWAKAAEAEAKGSDKAAEYKKKSWEQWDKAAEAEADGAKKAEEYRKKSWAAWDEAAAIEAEGAAKVADLRSELAAANREIEEYAKLQSSLTASLAEMEQRTSEFAVTLDITSELGSSMQQMEAFRKLASRTGIAFSKGFVERFASGGDEYQDVLAEMATWTDDKVANMVAAIDDLSRAERENELAQRELYVATMQYSDTKNAKDQWLDFLETQLDVREALNGNDGLAHAFRMAGTSVDGLAADLLSLGVSMDDLVAKAESFSSKVSDGFSAMSSANQAGVQEFSNTLKNNMAESSKYTENVSAVFSKLTDTALEESEAFRKAVLEGGFDKYAGLMADMATMDADQIMQVINLYNESIEQGLQDSIEQFQSLAPGEEMMIATIEGMEQERDELLETMQEIASAAADAGVELAPEFEAAGVSLMSSLSQGVLSQAHQIANSAASVVRQAIAAAQAEAAKAAAAAEAAAAKVKAASASTASAGAAPVTAAAKAAPAAYSAAPLKVGIDWYATGGVFDKAAIVGVAERGKEAVIPLSGPNMRPFATAIADQMAGRGGGGVTVQVNIEHFENKSDRDLDSIVSYVDRKIAAKTKTTTKSRGYKQ